MSKLAGDDRFWRASSGRSGRDKWTIWGKNIPVLETLRSPNVQRAGLPGLAYGTRQRVHENRRHLNENPAWNRFVFAAGSCGPTLSPLFPRKTAAPRDRLSDIFHLWAPDRLVTRVRIQGWLNVILWNMVSCFDRRIGFGTRYCYGSLHILNVKMEGSAFENVWKEKRRIK